MLKRLIVFGAVFFFIVNFGKSYAGNHEVIHPTKGHSIGWENPTAIPYWMDIGPLGKLTNSEARGLTAAMMDTWAKVETSRVRFVYQGNLPEDVTRENIADYLAMTSCGGSSRADIPKNVVPIIFDSDGKIIEYIAGMGSAIEIGGLATLRCFVGTLDNPLSIYQGMVIINGQFIDGKDFTEFSPADLSVNSIAGVMLHELGHLIGLDHSALNEEMYEAISEGILPADYSRYLPVMLPTVLRKSNSSTTLHPDDISAISTLYPATGYLSQVGDIEGEVVRSDGEEVRKVNVIARKEDDPLCEAVASLSGRRCVPLTDSNGRPNFNMTYCDSSDLYGDYTIEGLLPGDYTVEIEELDAGWVRSGMYPSLIDEDLPGDAEFYNGGDSPDESPYSFTLLDVGAGEIISEVDIVMSSSEAASNQLARIPIKTFEEGPASRCKTDPIDYAAVLSDEELSASFGSSAYESEGQENGGCELSHSSKPEGGWLVLLTLLGVILLFRRFYMRRSIRALLILTAILLVPHMSHASTIIPAGLTKMSQKAGKIFYGRCVDARVVQDERGFTSTLVTYEVLRGVKGTSSPMVTFKVFGVATDESTDQPSTLVGITRFYPGKEDILFLYEESPWGFTSPIGLWQGDFSVIQTEEGPRLSVTSKSYRSTPGVGLKAADSGKYPIVTPDDLLDEVEEMLNKQY